MRTTVISGRPERLGAVRSSSALGGWGGRCFEVIKLRSMTTEAEANGAQWASEGDPRVTKVGRILRKYRLDELPQFINVIRGDMSFVGPRPERPVFVEQLREHISY